MGSDVAEEGERDEMKLGDVGPPGHFRALLPRALPNHSTRHNPAGPASRFASRMFPLFSLTFGFS